MTPMAMTAPSPSGPIVANGRRFLAAVLDGLLFIVTLGIGWLVWDIILWGKGQSPGKMILKMRVHRASDGVAASWSEMVMRELVGKWLLGNITFGITTIIGCVQILMDKERHQALWDKIAKTVLIDERPVAAAM